MKIVSYGCIAALAVSAASTALGGTAGFITPASRGLPGSSFTGWETFTVSTNNGVGNFGDIAGSGVNARLTQLEPNALVLGSGNIYNQNFKSEFVISYSSTVEAGLVVLQVRTAGTELNYDSVKLDVGGELLGANRTELDRASFGVPNTPGSGAFVSSKWEWDISGKKAKDFSIRFGAADPSLSLDSATLDVSAVPEPSTWALLAGGAVAIATAGRRRRR